MNQLLELVAYLAVLVLIMWIVAGVYLFYVYKTSPRSAALKQERGQDIESPHA